MPGISPYEDSFDLISWLETRTKLEDHGYTTPCLVWTKGVDSSGYPKAGFFGELANVPQLVYLLQIGPIPEGHEPDHLCRTRRCVEVTHLEVVTKRENILRGQGRGALNARKEACPRGHPYDVVGANGKRYCKKCTNDSHRRQYRLKSQGLIPRPYQQEGIDFLAGHNRAALFDEPGLGKSMQALLAMRRQTSNQILIIATGDAWGTWEDEADLWLDEQAGMFVGLKPDEAELDRPIVVTSYKRAPFVLGERQWAGVIFDESQALRNRKTETRFKAIRSFFDNAKAPLARTPLYCLSGTPIVKAAGDLWPILHLIDRRRWSSYWRFVQEYAITWEDQFGWHTEGVTNVSALRKEVSSVALWRLIKDVMPDLPPKTRQRIPLTMTPRQAKAYNELLKEMMTEADLDGRLSDAGGLILAPTVLARETRLRQLLACPRILGIDDDGAALGMIVEHACSTTQPFVIYSPFVEALRFAEAALTKRAHRPTYFVRGGMGLKFGQTIKLFKQAAKSGESPILLCLTEMGKSWSISREVSYGYHLGFDWNDVTMHQAESRFDRDGQTEPSFAYYPVHADTHDFEALDILAGKKRLADAILARTKRWRR